VGVLVVVGEVAQFLAHKFRDVLPDDRAATRVEQRPHIGVILEPLVRVELALDCRFFREREPKVGDNLLHPLAPGGIARRAGRPTPCDVKD